MLSEERVKHMTKMAMFEKEEGKKIQPVIKYNQKDYETLRMIGGIFVGTVIYAVLYAFVLGMLYSMVMLNINMIAIIIELVIGVVLYILFLYVYLRNIKKNASVRYAQGVEVMKHMRRDYLELGQIYEKEESMTRPEGWE